MGILGNVEEDQDAMQDAFFLGVSAHRRLPLEIFHVAGEHREQYRSCSVSGNGGVESLDDTVRARRIPNNCTLTPRGAG